MRLSPRGMAPLALVCGFIVAAACGTGSDDDGCVPVDAISLSSEMYCPVSCATWTSMVVPQLPWHTGERSRLKPDYSSSPPRAEIAVGELFHANVSPRDMQPSGCNKGFDGPYTYRSTDPSVFVALNGVLGKRAELFYREKRIELIRVVEKEALEPLLAGE